VTTIKLYHEVPHVLTTRSTVLEVGASHVVLDRTPFYPEGGGQEGDHGRIGSLRVVDTTKRGGRPVVHPELPRVDVETEVVHHVEGSPASLAVGAGVEVEVDAGRRRLLTRLHSASHLVLGALAEQYPQEAWLTAGCHIGPARARLDLSTDRRLGGDALRGLQQRVDEWIASGAAVRMDPVPAVPEMFIWRCEASPALAMPCGGTHVGSLAAIGRVRLKRKREGRGLERIYIELEG
jgi:Ser-tRNA(Ala) deacylase AlaX